MPEPLFTYDYHEQFLDAVSKCLFATQCKEYIAKKINNLNY